MAKTDFLGGAFIFLIMFSIAMVQLYILKKAFRSQKITAVTNANTMNLSPEEFEMFNRCTEAGGFWTGFNNPEDPCCHEPKITPPSNVPVCLGGATVPFP